MTLLVQTHILTDVNTASPVFCLARRFGPYHHSYFSLLISVPGGNFLRTLPASPVRTWWGLKDKGGMNFSYICSHHAHLPIFVLPIYLLLLLNSSFVVWYLSKVSMGSHAASPCRCLLLLRCYASWLPCDHLSLMMLRQVIDFEFLSIFFVVRLRKTFFFTITLLNRNWKSL